MPLNIKNERVTELAQELAKLTGESLTEAVGHALEERIKSVRAVQDREERYQQAMQLLAKMQPPFRAYWQGKNPDEELYDERGLPK
jgi:antitoxin VapB